MDLSNVFVDTSMFTDCVSFALMKRLEITYVATFDDHFQRAGFQIEK